MSIKAAFFDIDGTLLSHKTHAVPEDTLESLARLRSRGIKLFTSTGRHILELDGLPVRDIEFDGYVLLNGQLCLDEKRNILSGEAIDRTDIENILPIFEEKQLPLGFVELDRLYMNVVNERVRWIHQEISTKVPDIDVYRGAPVYLINAFVDRKEAEGLLEQLPHCKMTWWNALGSDYISKSGGKVVGIQKMLEHHGIEREEIIAFGDGENDIEMLKYAGIGVAMGNGEECAKQSADYITDDIDAGGILHALQHYGI
ncbi:MAG: Cof-type HAD-IIB family hydrolase [Lachnospiraceae bacterium]|nr:Cof-type HAD-IIB family hydrolase [Lachnospiraceae bacterium]